MGMLFFALPLRSCISSLVRRALWAKLVLVRSSFPLLEGGNAVRFVTLFFSGLARCLLPFFSVLLFLGLLFAEIFGSELFFRVPMSVVFVLVLFCLCFCFIIWFFRPRKGSEKILFWSGPFF